MSWALHTAPHPKGDIVSALENTEPATHVAKDQLDQIRAAKEAAIKLLKDGDVGSADGTFSVGLAGHAGAGIESLTININVVPPTPAPPTIDPGKPPEPILDSPPADE